MTLCGANMNMMAWNLAVIWNAIYIYINTRLYEWWYVYLVLPLPLCVRARPNDFKHNKKEKRTYSYACRCERVCESEKPFCTSQTRIVIHVTFTKTPTHSLTHLLKRGSVGCNTMCDTNGRRRGIKWVVATVIAAAADAVAAVGKCAEHKNKIWLNQFAYDI